MTSFILDDLSHFEQAVEHAEASIAAFGWQDADTLLSQSRSNWLPSARVQLEVRSATELHFWVAEACQRLANLFGTESVDGRNWLQRGLVHNLRADSFSRTRSNAGLTGIPIQRLKIELALQPDHQSSQSSASGPVELADSLTNASDRLDRFMIAFVNRRQRDQSIELLTQLVEEAPADFLAWLLLGQHYYLRHQQAQAQACFSMCVGLENNNSYPLLYRAMSKLRENKNIVSAINDLKTANQLSPNDRAILQNLALAFIKQSDFANALQVLDQAIELGTAETRVWYLRSGVKKALGDHEGAVWDLEHFIAAEPTDSLSWVTRGNQKIAHDPDSAIHDLRAALRTDPYSVAALDNLAYVYSEVLSDLNSAIAAMDQVIQLEPHNAKHFTVRGVLHARRSDRQAALADAESALVLDSSAEIKYRVAGIYALTSKSNPKDADQAILLFSKATSMDPPTVWRLLASDPDLKAIEDHYQYQKIYNLLRQFHDLTTHTPSDQN